MTVAAMRYVLSRIAEAMGCEPESDDDLVEAVRLLVSERDQAQAQARLGKMIAGRIQAERDEARAERQRAIDDALATSDAWWGEQCMTLQRQRDEARVEVERLRAALRASPPRS